MKEFVCDTCPINDEYLNGGECHCSKIEKDMNQFHNPKDLPKTKDDNKN